MPIAGYRPAGSRPAVIAVCFSLRAAEGSIQTERKVKYCVLPAAHPGADAKVAYAHHNSNRNVLDEWVFRLEGTDPSTKKANR